MKFIRFLLSIIICLLAVYGGYQLYVQYNDRGTDPEKFAKEMRDLGFDVGEDKSKTDFSVIMQSDLGTPTSSFGMGDTSNLPGNLQANTSPSINPPTEINIPDFLNNANKQTDPSGNAYSNGLPPTLRSSTSESISQQQTMQSVQTPQMPQPPRPSSVIIFPEQENVSSDAVPADTQDDVPDVLSPLTFDYNIELPLPIPPSSESAQPTTTAQTLLSSNTISTEIVPMETHPPSTAPTSANTIVPTPSFHENATQVQSQVQLSEPSPYTFNVVTPSAVAIDTTVPQQQPQPIAIAAIMPNAPQPGSPCVQEMPIIPSPITAPSQVQPLPTGHNDSASAASVNPPVFIPRLSVTALPPTEEDAISVDPAEAGFATAGIRDAQMVRQPAVPSQINVPQDSMQPIVMMPPVQETTSQLVSQPMQYPPPSQQTTLQPIDQQQMVQQPMIRQPAVPLQIEQPHPAMVDNVKPLPQSQNEEIAPEILNKVAAVGNLLTQNRVAEAYEQLSNMYFYDEMTPEERQYVARHLDQLAGGLLFSKRHHVFEPAYAVREGDTIESIARQYKITPELLRKLNGIPADTMALTGTQLKVIRGPLDARIYPDKHELVVVSRGNYACRFPISVGSGYAGQAGNFTVQDKALDRAYQLAPGLGVIPPGDPDNPLGSRWIELSKEQGTIGVHGTNSPQVIGTTRQSAGIFGLREQDVAEVYDMLIVGSNVTIVR